MGKIVFLLIFLLEIIAATTFAQDQDPWVGEWTSEVYTVDNIVYCQ